MKVSSREGDLSGCTAWGPRAALPPGLPSAACGLRRPASRPGCLGRCVVSGPSRRLGPRPPGYLGAREAAAQPGPGQAWAVWESFLITGVN